MPAKAPIRSASIVVICIVIALLPFVMVFEAFDPLSKVMNKIDVTRA